jgi:hypothetical protein
MLPNISGQPQRQRMTSVTIRLTIRELELLIGLASDQLFRREFIDPKMPGYRANSGEITLSKLLIGRLRSLLEPGAAKKAPSGNMTR